MVINETGPMVFSSDYWIFSGSSRNEANWFDNTQYGIQINEAPGANDRCIYWRCSYSTLTYVFVNANPLNLALTQTVADYQIDWTGGNMVYAGNISHCCVINGNNHFFMRNCNGCIIEYCGSSNALSASTPAQPADNHGENVNWYSGFGPCPNCICRYCKFYNNFVSAGGGGTAVIAIEGMTGGQIYGNIFATNRCGDGIMGWNGTKAGYACSGMQIYNNTIVGSTPSGSTGINLPGGSAGNVYNNLWWNCSGGYTTGITGDYNAAPGSLGETHGQVLSSNPFVNYASQDYHLKANTSPGIDLGSPYNMDMDGNTRAIGSASRGAYQYEISGSNTNPPVLSAIGASSVDATGAVVAWTTDTASSSAVDYGSTTAYGSTVGSSTLVTAHSVVLSGLSQNALYHYRVHSTDSSGNISTSGDFTFRTAIAEPPAPPTGLRIAGL
jgi:hypothetical protein